MPRVLQDPRRTRRGFFLLSGSPILMGSKLWRLIQILRPLVNTHNRACGAGTTYDIAWCVALISGTRMENEHARRNLDTLTYGEVLSYPQP